MSSDNIRERNRKNAQHSTGPKTAEGKAKSSRKFAEARRVPAA